MKAEERKQKQKDFKNLVMKISSFIDSCDIDVFSYLEQGDYQMEFQRYETSKGLIVTKRLYNDVGKEIAYILTLDNLSISIPERIVSPEVEKAFTDISQDLRSLFYNSHYDSDYSDYNYNEYSDE